MLNNTKNKEQTSIDQALEQPNACPPEQKPQELSDIEVNNHGTRSESSCGSDIDDALQEPVVTNNSWLNLIPGVVSDSPLIGTARKVLLCTAEQVDDSVKLTPIRKRKKRENHKHDALVVECRKRKLNGSPLFRIACDMTLDYIIVERWDKRGWLDIQPTKKSKRLKEEAAKTEG